MQRGVLLSFSEQDLEENFLRFQQAVEELEFCLVTVLEEHDELHSTNQMLKEIASNLKPIEESTVVCKPRGKPSQWSTAMQEILNEKPPVHSATEPERAIPRNLEEVPSQTFESIAQTKDLSHVKQEDLLEEEKLNEKKFKNEQINKVYESGGKKEISEDEETKTSECAEQVEIPKQHVRNAIRDIRKPPIIQGKTSNRRPPKGITASQIKKWL